MGWGPGAAADIYWIKIDALIDSLRYTNFEPYVRNLSPDQTGYVGLPFNFTIPDSTFVDDDGNNTLTYHAKLTNGNPLPGWLAFDTLTATFSGTPITTGTLDISITATDTAQASISTPLKIIVENQNGIYQEKDQDVRIFPNPTSGLLTISVNAFHEKATVVEIKNPEGVTILRKQFKKEIGISLGDRPKGMYFVKLTAGNNIILRKSLYRLKEK